MVSVLNTLGVGSGVDTTALIDALVGSERTPREAALTARSTKVEARISGLAQVRAGLDGLVSALTTRTRGGQLGPLPASSDTAIVVARPTAGATPRLQPATLEVRALAGGQTLIAAALAGKNAAVGQGVLTLRTGTMMPDGNGSFAFAGGVGAAIEVHIGATDNTLGGLRDAINAAQPAIVASIIDDGSGARLVLKGATGAASAFIITADPAPGDVGLTRFVHMPGSSAMTAAFAAHDARLLLDGVPVTRGGNTVADLIPGVTLDLKRIGPPVTIGVSRDGEGIKTAVRDLAATLTALGSLTASLVRPADAQSEGGPLAGDSALRRLRQQMTSLTATPVLPGAAGAPTRLADLGVVTARDGSLSIDEAILAATVARAPDAVDALLTTLTSGGGALKRIQTELAGSVSSSGATAPLTRERAAVAAARATLTVRTTSYRATLVRQYAAMEAAVAGSKSTQSFLDNQIKAWNRTT